jgi:endogenous inhibitor of DNA gyrase (YacG/DUF329 family)
LRERHHSVDLNLWAGEQVIDLDQWLDENEDVDIDVEMPVSQSYCDIPDSQDYYDAPSSPAVSPAWDEASSTLAIPSAWYIE